MFGHFLDSYRSYLHLRQKNLRIKDMRFTICTFIYFKLKYFVYFKTKWTALLKKI